ncbi:MAG: winged helix-turn-helix domain-containing protein [Candidatus Nanosalina sp.]
MEDTVGEIAGYIWNHLENEGECSLTAINEAVDEPRSRVNMAIGWLTREGKLEFNNEGRGVSVKLK